MNLVQKFGVTATSAAVLTALAFAPLIASADNDKRKGDDNRRAMQRVEIAITDSGNVLVRGGKMTAVSGNTITVTTTAGASTLTWTVTTDSSTSFLTSAGSGSSIAEIRVGDTISFAGALSGTGLTVKATAVKDWTAGVNERSIVGTVQSVNATSSSLTIVNGKDKDNDNKKVTTIQFTGSTGIVSNGAGTTFGSIVAGDKVKATGTVNADGTVLTATSVTVTHPPVKLGNDDFGKKIRAWFSNHGFGFFGGKDDNSGKSGDNDKGGKDD